MEPNDASGGWINSLKAVGGCFLCIIFTLVLIPIGYALYYILFP